MAVDFFVIMDYDISGPEFPWANCPLNVTELGTLPTNLFVKLQRVIPNYAKSFVLLLVAGIAIIFERRDSHFQAGIWRSVVWIYLSLC